MEGERTSGGEIRAEPLIPPIDHDEDQDGGYGGHRNGGRVGASVSEATNDLQHF